MYVRVADTVAKLQQEIAATHAYIESSRGERSALEIEISRLRRYAVIMDSVVEAVAGARGFVESFAQPADVQSR